MFGNMEQLARLLTALGYIVARTPYHLTAHRAADGSAVAIHRRGKKYYLNGSTDPTDIDTMLLYFRLEL